MKTNLESKLREVAEYWGYEFSGEYAWPPNGVRMHSIDDLDFEADWQKLNPVWSKVRSELWDIIGNMPANDYFKKYHNLKDRYHSAVDNDNVAEAFEVVFEAVKLLQELKK